MAATCGINCLAAVALLAFLAGVQAGLRHPPECEGLTCQDTAVMRYNGTCYCQANPCAGHACKDREYPHLEFEYSSTGRLSCHCTKPCPQGLCTGERKPPRCVEGGHHCPNKAQPVLHVDEDKCKCKSHPCVVAGRAACDDAALPMLDYSFDDKGHLDCFCRKHPCPTFTCDEEDDTSLVDWDQEGHCHCRAPNHDEL